MLHELFCAILAAIWCSLITPSIRRGALQLGAFDEPGGRRVHRERAPRLGGLAVFLAGASALLVGSLMGPALGTTYAQQHLGQPGLVCGALIILATGVMDDLWNLSPRTKLAAESVATLLALASGFQIAVLDSPFSDGPITLGLFALPITFLWVLCITNAVNVIDGLDGLATGVALIASASIWVIASFNGQVTLAVIAATLAGALVGFLFHNFHPATIFLGDSGSLLLGYLLAILSIDVARTETTEVKLWIPLLLLGLPLLDLLLAAARRFLRPFRQQDQPLGFVRLCRLGMRTMLQPDHHHIHHRLLAYGFTHHRAVLILYTLAILCSCTAISLRFFP